MKNKFNKTSFNKLISILVVIIKISYWSAIINVILSVLAFICTLIFTNITISLTKLLTKKLTFTLDNMIVYSLNNVNLTLNSGRHILLAIFILSIIVSFILALIFKELKFILKTIEKDNPFNINNVNKLRNIGGILVIGSFIIKAAVFYKAKVLITTLELKNITVIFYPDSSMITIGFLVLLLSRIFRYGFYLQKEYDGTV